MHIIEPYWCIMHPWLMAIRHQYVTQCLASQPGQRRPGTHQASKTSWSCINNNQYCALCIKIMVQCFASTAHWCAPGINNHIYYWCLVHINGCTALSHNSDAWCTVLSIIDAWSIKFWWPDAQHWATYWCLIALSHGCTALSHIMAQCCAPHQVSMWLQHWAIWISCWCIIQRYWAIWCLTHSIK